MGLIRSMPLLAARMRFPTYLSSKPRASRWASTLGPTVTATNTAMTGEPEGGPLHDTVASHRCYILIHTTQPPSEFPARLSTPVQRALQLKASKWGGIVNFSWFGNQSGATRSTTGIDQYGQPATAFSAAGGRLEIPRITIENVDEIEEKLRRHAEGRLGVATPAEDDEIHLYVCTHGARDCRCGTTGGQVFKALQEEVARRTALDPQGAISRVKVGAVGHVGGHQYAGNLLAFPYGEWLGRLKADDVPKLLQAILERPRRPFTALDPPLLPAHWRGRTGLAKDEQVELFTSHQAH